MRVSGGVKERERGIVDERTGERGKNKEEKERGELRRRKGHKISPLHA